MSDYQEIDFVETNVETIETELLNMYEEIMNESVAPGSPVRLFIMWIAQVIVQQRVIINDSAKSNVPRYARGEYLDSLSELFWDEQRLKSDYARAMFRFYLSEAQQVNIEIPAGTRITPDGDLMFATTETIMIKAGQTYGDVEAVCETAGEIGNDYKPGQINIIIDPYDYYDHAENTETTLMRWRPWPMMTVVPRSAASSAYSSLACAPLAPVREEPRQCLCSSRTRAVSV